MLVQILLLLFAAFSAIDGAAVARGHAPQDLRSPTTCGCTTTITEFLPQELVARQECTPTSTVTIYQAPPTVWIVSGDAASIASSFSYASQIDSMVHHQSSEDRPTGEPPETTPILYTVTALGPAVVGTDYPDDESILYHNIGTTTAPVATTTITFAAEVTPAQHGHIVQTTVTETTYLSTITVTPSESSTSASSNLSMTSPSMQKRQICSMIFASIDGQWVSWCNEWNGYTTVKYSSYISTVLITHPPGADPIPTSVYESSTTSEISETIQTSLPESTSTATSVPIPAVSSTSPSVSMSTSSTISSSTEGVLTTEIGVTATVVVTYPIATITYTSNAETSSSGTAEVPAASPSCGQVGDFIITFDDLPTFSTNKPDNETTSPPIFNPYSHFYWSAGYGYGPPPNEPFAPHDGTELAEYSPAYEPSTMAAHAQGRDLPGSFGAGSRSSNSVFWFDAKSVYVGCNSTGIEAPCTLVATGYLWIDNNVSNATTSDGHEQLAFIQTFQIPGPCADKGCPLSQISFANTTFSGLSTLNLAAYARDGEKVGFFLDSFEAAWTNNTCEAGRERSMSRR